MDFLVVSDAFIGETYYKDAVKLLQANGHSVEIVYWGPAQKVELENIIRGMEQRGPSFDQSLHEVSRRLGEKQGLLVDFCPVPDELMERLKIIGVCRANTSNVDMKRATEKRIPVIGVRGRNAGAVAEFTIGLMLAESRHIARSHLNLTNGSWIKEYDDDPNEIEGKTIGIIGFGAIGKAVAKKLTGFGCRILYYDPFVQKENEEVAGVSLDTLLADSDFITIHVGLTKETRHLITKDQFDTMKPSAYLINTARAEIIDQDALVNALATSRIRGAALDVFVEEPLLPNSPLLKLANITLTAHLAGATQESLSKSPLLLVRNILRYLGGDPNCNIQNKSILGHSHA
jgi:D-3-phosphoglycerate dehydrogenase / 2-oxoglutarate reductase